MNPQSPAGSDRVSVVAPFGPAIDRARDLLFRPFDLHRWLVIGFTAWLATLAEGYTGGGGGGGSREGVFRRWEGQWDQAMESLRDNLYWIVPLLAVVACVAVAIGLLLLWLSSRGRFMFLHNVATLRAEVAAPWHRYRTEGDSLFLFRAVLTVISGVVMIPMVIAAGIAVMTMVRREEVSALPLLVTVIAALAGVAVGFATLVIAKLTKDFVVPVMYLRGGRCLPAWREFGRLLASHPIEFLLYLLFYALLHIGVGVMTIVVVIATCCIAGCLLSLPYIGTVVFLPVLTFYRAYSAAFLAQFGAPFDVFRPTETPTLR